MSDLEARLAALQARRVATDVAPGAATTLRLAAPTGAPVDLPVPVLRAADERAAVDNLALASRARTGRRAAPETRPDVFDA